MAMWPLSAQHYIRTNMFNPLLILLCFDYLLNIDKIYLDQVVDRIYPPELQLNKANSSDTETPFWDLNLCIFYGTVFTKIYDIQDDFDFDMVNFLLWMAMSPGVPHMRYTYLILLDSPELLQILVTLTGVKRPFTAKLFRQSYRYFKIRKAFSKFYGRHSALVEKYNVGRSENTSATMYIGTRILR